ncbi:hypothetical protein HDU80_010190, partial [Chytriomyces hyalinus]
MRVDPFLLNTNSLVRIESEENARCPPGFHISTNTPADGNCFFHATARLLNDPANTAAVLRAASCHVISMYPNEFKEGCRPETPVSFANHLSHDGVFAEDQNVTALAHHLQRKFVVLEKLMGRTISKSFTPRNINVNLATIFLHCDVEAKHYERCEPVIVTPPGSDSSSAKGINEQKVFSPPLPRIRDIRTSAIEAALKRTHRSASDEIISLIVKLSTAGNYSAKTQKMWKTTANVLSSWQEKDFPTEGYECKCGQTGCKRWVWNSQVTYDRSIDRLKAQRSRCGNGSKDLNADSNEV